MQDRLLWFLPGSVRNGDRGDLRRALLTVAACAGGAILASLIGAMQAVWGLPLSALACAVCAAVSAGALFWLRHTGR